MSTKFHRKSQLILLGCFFIIIIKPDQRYVNPVGLCIWFSHFWPCLLPLTKVLGHWHTWISLTCCPLSYFIDWCFLWPRGRERIESLRMANRTPHEPIESLRMWTRPSGEPIESLRTSHVNSNTLWTNKITSHVNSTIRWTNRITSHVISTIRWTNRITSHFACKLEHPVNQ